MARFTHETHMDFHKISLAQTEMTANTVLGLLFQSHMTRMKCRQRSTQWSSSSALIK